MKRTFKKLVSVLLVFIMLAAFAPIGGFNLSTESSALESSGKCGDNVYYTFDESTGLLTISGTGEMDDYEWDGSPFYENSSIKTVVIENGVTSIGECAFFDCESLTSVTIPDSVTSIGDYAFSYCEGITSITIPDSVTSIGECAFFDCESLTSVTIPDSVTSIGDYAFSYCEGITSITIPNSVTSIGDSAFSWCESLESITIPDGVTSIGNYAFYNCTGLTSITIPDSVTSIGDYAFEFCESLTSVTIPDSVTSIGYEAFCECSHLKTVFYSGTQDEWNEISIDSENSYLTESNIHFGVSAEEVVTHLRTEIVQEPTCINSGEMAVTCDCGYSYEEYIPALGHIKGSILKTVEPTCTNRGYTIYRCERCNENFYDDYVDALGHNIENGECTRCGAKKTVVDISLNETRIVKSEIPGDETIFKFTPVESGTYYFYSLTNIDTIGIVYDSNMNELYYDDDGGDDYNFKILYDFEAGKTYYLAAKPYYTDENYEITVTLSDEFERMTIMPGSGTVIDENNKFIYGIKSGLFGRDLSCCLFITNPYEIDSDNFIGTGSTLSLLTYDDDDNPIVTDTYTFVVFGDVNGDGWYDGTDSIIVNCLANGMLTREQVGEAVYMAADCNHDGVIDSLDVALLEQAGMILASVDQSKSAEELQTDSAYQEYINLIDQTVEDNTTGETDTTTETPVDEQFNQTLLQRIFAFFKYIFKLIVSLF